MQPLDRRGYDNVVITARRNDVLQRTVMIRSDLHLHLRITAMNTLEMLVQRSFRLAARLVIGAVLMIGAASVASAQGLPCDIYGSAGTACVAAHSTTRALFSAYSGRLYQVRR
ncbi:MAG TPA: arabinofuranosidase catalytic domain-containing protein, partial [Kofleriaceae bacterium]